jgi:hypothetical protein
MITSTWFEILYISNSLPSSHNQSHLPDLYKHRPSSGNGKWTSQVLRPEEGENERRALLERALADERIIRLLYDKVYPPVQKLNDTTKITDVVSNNDIQVKDDFITSS